MRQNEYSVHFTEGPSMMVWAFNSCEATILAQAARIMQGETYNVTSCIKL